MSGTERPVQAVPTAQTAEVLSVLSVQSTEHETRAAIEQNTPSYTIPRSLQS